MVSPIVLTLVFCFFGLLTMVSVYARWNLIFQSLLKAGTTTLLLPLTFQFLKNGGPQTLIPLVVGLSFATVADFLLHLELPLGVAFFALVQACLLVYGLNMTLYWTGLCCVAWSAGA
jgi:hypothetical protein